MGLRAAGTGEMARVGIAWLVLGLGLAAPAWSGEAPKAAGWVDAGALAYVELVRPEALIDRALSPEIRGFLKAVPGLEDQLDKAEVRQLRVAADLVGNLLDVKVETAVRDLTAGGVVLALEGEEKPDRIILIVTPRDRELLGRAHEKILELARSDARDKKKDDPVQRHEHRGVAVYQFSPAEAHAIVDDALVVTNGLETLKTIIDRAKGQGGHTPITGDAAWKGRRGAIGDDAVAFAFARLDRLRKLDPDKFGGKERDPGAVLLLGAWYEALLEGPWASASLTWTDAKFAADLTVAAPPDGYSEAMKTFLPPEGQGAAPLVKTPGAILSVSLWRDLSAAWEVRDRLLQPEQLQGLAQLDSFAGQFFGGRDFGTGVLGALRPDWRIVIANQDFAAIKPNPDTKLPAFALLASLDPEDEEFAVRLQSAFQSFVGLVNLGAAQTKAPPLMLGSEELDGVTISKGTYLPQKQADSKEAPGDPRFNFSPSAAQVDDTFVLSSSLGLARELVKALKPGDASPSADAPRPTLVAEADGAELARLVEMNRDRLAMNNMLEKGNTKPAAEAEIDLLARLARYLGRGRLTIQDGPDGVHAALSFDLVKP